MKPRLFMFLFPLHLLAASVGCSQQAPLGIPDGVGAGAGGQSQPFVSGTGGAIPPVSSAGGWIGFGSGGAGVGGAPATSASGCDPISRTPGVFNPCGRTYGLAFSPDGKILASGTQTARPNTHLWRMSDGAHLRDLDGIGTATFSVAFSPDGTTLATAGDSGNGTGSSPDVVKLWDVTSGALLRTIPTSCGWYADSVAFSPDGTLLATAGYMGSVEVWRVSDGTRVTAIDYPTSVHNVHFAPVDPLLIVAGVDGRATIWTIPEGNLVHTLDGIADEMADGAYSADAYEIATTGPGNVVRIWYGQGSLLGNLQPAFPGYVSHVLWLGSAIVVANDWTGAVYFWSRGSASSFVRQHSWSTGGQSLGLAALPDGTIVAGGGNGSVEGFVFLSSSLPY